MQQQGETNSIIELGRRRRKCRFVDTSSSDSNDEPIDFRCGTDIRTRSPIYPCELFNPARPKTRTISSSWFTRNDSSNISSVLTYADVCKCPSVARTGTPSTSIRKSPKKTTECKLHKPPSTHKVPSLCYCNKTGIKPTLIERPSRCVCPQRRCPHLSYGYTSYNINPSTGLKETFCLKCYKEKNQLSESSKRPTQCRICKNILEQFKKAMASDHHGHRRKSVKKKKKSKKSGDRTKFKDAHTTSCICSTIRRGTETDFPKRLDCCIQTCRKRRKQRGTATEFRCPVCTSEKMTCMEFVRGTSTAPKVMKDQGQQCEERGANDVATAFSLEDMINFRKDHYLETHKCVVEAKEYGDHVCVHKFQLDDRMFPVPENSDEQGHSLCLICGKLMEFDAPMPCMDERLQKSIKGQINMASVRKTIHDVNVDALTPAYGILGRYSVAANKPEHYNTLALRYQKLMPYRN